MRFPRLTAAATLGVALFLTGCGEFFTPVNNHPGGTSSSFVYVANVTGGGTAGTISEYSLSGGVLTALTGSPITLPAVPTSLVVSPNNVSVYVGTTTGVLLYTIGTDGTLTEGNNDTVLYLPGALVPKTLVMDSTSSWLIIANQNSSVLNALAVSPTTGLATGSGVVTASLSSATPQQLAITAPTSNVSTLFVALAAGGTEAISFNAAQTQPFASTATVLKLATTSTSASAVAVDPTSTYAYITEVGSPDILRNITIKTLAQDGSNYTVGNSPSAILAETTGAYVYVANGADNKITGFSQSAGVLTALADSPFDTAKTPLDLVEDNSKTYVLCVGSGNNPNLWVYKFDATTAGTLDVASSISTGTTDPSGTVGLAVTH